MAVVAATEAVKDAGSTSSANRRCASAAAWGRPQRGYNELEAQHEAFSIAVRGR
jgi:hypothetical protein